MTTQQSIITALYATLSGYTAAGSVYALTGGRIYASAAPQDAALPLVIVTPITDLPELFFDAADNPEFTFQLDVYGKMGSGDAETRAIADAAYAQLHRSTPTMSGYEGVVISCEDRGGTPDRELVMGVVTQNDAWRISQTYRVWASGT